MTTLLWQTALLLLGAYFLGAFSGCLIRRTFFAPAPARPAERQPTPGAAAPPRRLEEPAPVAAAAGGLAAGGEFAEAPASAYLERPPESETDADGSSDQAIAYASPTQPAGDEPVPSTNETPVSPGSAEPRVERTPPSNEGEASPPERRVRSIGTSAAAAAALAAATARQQAAARTAAERAERDEQPPLPAAAGSSGQSSTWAPRVDVPAATPAQSTAEPQPSAPASDDLTRIRGIDPDLHQRLIELGVRRYAEIAEWRKDDVRRISQALGFRGRIEQENWIEQAQILMNGGETAYSRSRQTLAKPSPDEGEQRPITSAAASRPTAKGPPAAVASTPASGTGPRTPILGLGRDNLQRISRITPEIERLLNAQGVSRYDQIAHWTTADVARIDQLLGADGRISRENWIEQAQILARGGETAYSREFDRQRANINPPRPTQLAEAIRAAQAEKAGEPPRAPEREPSKNVDLNKLRSVRSQLFRTEEREAARSIGPGSQGAVRTDDLKRIRGIGVLIEKRLNSMGYRTYEQIANWTAADVERISRALDIPGRIEQENWIEQARILASGKQTEFARRLDRG